MLDPNVIPSEEPFLDVGIILPEDQYEQFEMEIPQLPLYCYRAATGDFVSLDGGAQLHFKLKNRAIKLELNGKDLGTQSTWIVKPTDNRYQIGYRTGILMKQVPAGRGFHWYKRIEIFLPGSILVKIIDNTLVVVNRVPLEQYLMCVATSEMSAECPPALIESQTIVARSWMLANVEMKHRQFGMDVCNDDCCQRYQGTTYLSDESRRGALHTYGQVLIHRNQICDTRYFKNCGGKTEAYKYVFGEGKVEVPYLKPVIDAPPGFQHEALPLETEAQVRHWVEDQPATFCSPRTVTKKELVKYLGSVDEVGEYFRWSFRYPQKEFTALLNLKQDLQAAAILAIYPIQRGQSGRLVKVRIDYRDRSGRERSLVVEDQYVIRQTFHELFLYSSAFVVDVEGEEEKVPTAFVLKGAGWGHGVGLCQVGALGMALRGYSADEIVHHYYPIAELRKIY